MPVRFVSRWISLPALISGLLLNAPAIAVAQSTAYQTVVITDDSGAQTSFAAAPEYVSDGFDRDHCLAQARPGTGAVAERGQSIAGEMRARRDTVVQAVADAPRPKLFYEMDASDQTKPFAAGPNGFYGQLVDLAGAGNIYADVAADFAQVSAESVVAMLAARPGWARISAVESGAVYAVQEELFASPSPRLADGLETLAYLVHPDRFAASGGPHLSPIDGVRPYCAPGQMPAFSFGFAVLGETLGTSMGEPTECAHAEVASGDTYQPLLTQRWTAPDQE
jgi:hypothetical protein